MRRRIVIAVIGSVVVALVLAGMGTLLLSRVSARDNALDELSRTSSALAELVSVSAEGRPQVRRSAIQQVRSAFKISDFALILIGPNGGHVGSYPAGVTISASDEQVLMQGGTVSGVGRRGVLYAATGRTVARSTVIVAVTGADRPLLGGAAGWFLLASAIALLLAVVLAFRVATSIAGPVRRATAVTEQIAGGDLSARLPDPPPTSQDELAVLSRSVNTMADRLERSRGLEQQFLLSVSHDLRTPLTSIRGYAEAISDGAAPDARAAADVILAESMRLERLVGDLLDLGRLESGQFTLHPRPVDAGEVVSGAAEGFRLEAGRHDLGLEVRSVPVPMSLDPDRLAQIVGNLLGNAMRFARSTIVVEVHRVPEGVRFAVSNDGPGIPAADLPYIFERLYQSGQRPVRTESGSGLGLAIVRELVGAMNGTVTVSSPDTGGVSFRVELPDHGAPVGTVDPPTAPT